MTTWLTKLKISQALDDGKPLAPAVKRAVAQSTELRQFANDVFAVDRVLKNRTPAPAVPAGLHAGIMRAVRSAELAPRSGWEVLWERFIPASALALLVLLSLFGTGRSSRSPAEVAFRDGLSSLAIASSTLEAGGTLVRTMPEAALNPLANEMLRLNRDLTNAQNYLLAALP